MSPSDFAPPVSSGTGTDLDAQRLLRGLKRNWMQVVLIAGFVLTITLGITLMQPYRYTATSTLVIQNKGGAGDLASLAASFAPGLMPAADGPNILTELEVMRSRSILRRVVEEEHLEIKVTDHGRMKTLGSRVMEKFQVLTGAIEPPAPVDLQVLERPLTFLDVAIPLTLSRVEWELIRTGESSFTVRDLKSRTDLGTGILGQPFEVQGARFTIAAIEGAIGDRYGLRFRSTETALRDLQELVETRRVRDRADVMAITYSDTSPVLAKIITNAVSDSYLKQSLEWESEYARATDAVLATQIVDSERELLAAQGRLNEYRATRETVILSKEAEGLIGQLTVAQTTLMNQQMDTQQLQFAYDRLRAADDRGFLVFLSGASAAVPVQAAMVESLSELITRRDGMLVSRTSEHPEVQRLDAQIAASKEQILGLVKQALDSARNQTGLLQGQVSRLDAERLTIPETETTLFSLNADVQLNAQLLAALKQRKQSNELNQAAQTSPIRVLDPAIAPLRNSSPRWPMNLLLGALVGLVLGIVTVLAREAMDTSVRTREQAETLGLPVVAQIPLLQEHLKPRTALNNRVFLALRHDPLGPIAESFRILRSATNFATGGAIGRVLGITSAGTGEGKTLVTLNLASMYAQAGLRTLVIDTDLRRPAVARSFGIPVAPGLTDVLERGVELQSAIRESGINNLWLLTAGERTPNPSELLTGLEFAKLLQSLRREPDAPEAGRAPHFDVVLLDLPPVEAVSETISLGRLTTALYLLIRAGKTPLEIAADALRRLAYSKVAVRGLILNGVSREDLGNRAAAYLYYNYTDEGVEERGLWERLTGQRRRRAAATTPIED